MGHPKHHPGISASYMTLGQSVKGGGHWHQLYKIGVVSGVETEAEKEKEIQEDNLQEESRDGGRKSRYYSPFPFDACFQNYICTIR